MALWINELLPAFCGPASRVVSGFGAGAFARVLAAVLAVALSGCGGGGSRPVVGQSADGVAIGTGVQNRVWSAQIRPAVYSSRALGGREGRVQSTRPKGGGYYKVGRPYLIAGRRYTPSEQPNYSRVGLASWYGTDFDGKRTANGETYDMGALSAAHKTLPMPSYAYVTNLQNNRTVLVRINDRGPFKPGRIIDLSRRVADELGFKHHGLAKVRVRYGGPAPLDGNDEREQTFLMQQSWHRHAAR